MRGRIWFPGNPWPDGHAIATAQFAGRLDGDTGTLALDLDLQTVNYDAEGPGRETRSEGSWTSPVVWNNYHRCSLGSRKWGHKGIPIGSPAKPFAWRKLDGATLRVDRAKDVLPEDDDCSFGIYLLGHDGVADHAIAFTRTAATWSIDWRAKIALAYAGDVRLVHRMKAELRGVAFAGFDIPKGLSKPSARRLFDACVTDPDAWSVEDRRFVRTRRRGR